MDELLSKVEDVEELSFYGLMHWLEEVSKLLDRADHVAVSKAPKAEDKAIADRKDELIDAQGRLRKAVAVSLESPSLTKREKPLAEKFCQEQLQKLQAQVAKDDRAAKASQRLKDILDSVRGAPVVQDSKAVRDLEAQIKQAETDWKELSPTYDKWEKGRHSFKSNADLQTFKRRYEECKKLLDSAPAKLEQAICARHSGKLQEKEKPEDKSWTSTAKRAAPPPRPQMNNDRGAAAMALDAKAKAAKKKSAPKISSSWDTADVSLAQRLRAEAAAGVRDGPRAKHDAEGEDEAGEEDGFWEDGGKPTRPPPPPIPKAPPAKAASNGRRWAATNAESEEEEEEAEHAVPQKQDTKIPAKKKSSNKKKTPQGEENEAPPAQVRSFSFGLLRGSALHEIRTRPAFRASSDVKEALLDLQEKLGLLNPLGLVLDSDWQGFVNLKVDGGPQRTSKRGESPWLARQKINFPRFLAHYLTILYFLRMGSALASFELQFLLLVLQMIMLIAPGEIPHVQPVVQTWIAQVAHVLLW
eukprot:CAMPEP_0197638942 /NCGR_PEP_ID=MMETSP1338-20131121/13718_1 /TAXON_ID=43686 ORGANISM="Pelagodinium beii, Strain RCC1491" /NCGR_SAMPLE_ID=MMETSP1338 /ASSEMBLY_ACC=CAM_ASM_000754 /LENGTH=526 /DNA_ID=CAMNT_0043211605 /DNA_START=1 /DNA_END=1578 /DNA_ORIENTATION=+